MLEEIEFAGPAKERSHLDWTKELRMMRWARKLKGAWWLAWYIWPGLTPLWIRGSWAGLAAAAVFALLLNITLAATCLWPQLLAPSLRGAMWAAVSIAWLMGVVANRRWRGWRLVDTALCGGRDLFPDAVGEYLRGNWIEAEKLVGRILCQRPEDVETRLLWISVLRRTRRTDEALRRLRELNRFESATRWRWEIEAEMEYLERAIQNENRPPSDDPTTGPSGDKNPVGGFNVAGNEAA